MNDIRNLLSTLERINEAQQWDALDAIVNKYARKGMLIGELASMEKAARAAEPEDSKKDDNIFSKGFNFLKQAASTEDFRVKYVFAHASNKLGLPGLYDVDGKNFYYLDDQGEAAQAGTANKSEATKIHAAGLLPANIAQKFNLTATATPTSPQTSADDKDTGWKNPNELVLSDGSKFNLGNKQSERLARQKFAKLLSRYNQLIRKVNESAPASMRGYLDDFLFEALLTEALTPEETTELQNLYQDLMALANFGGSKPVLGNFNAKALKKKLAKAPEVAKQKPTKAEPADDGSEDNMDDKANTGDIEPGKSYKPTSKTLADFAKSGKGGLQNDPDEVDAIKDLQTMLDDQGFDLSADGKYGSKTMRAVLEFQKALGLKADGDAGPNTIAALLPFDNFIYSEGGTLKDMLADIEKAKGLINKGKGTPAGTAAGKPDSAMMKPESIMRDMISLVESMLAEGLSQAEMDELTAIRDNLKDALGQLSDPGVPQAFKDQITNAINDAGTIGVDTDPKELPPEKTKTDLDAEKASAESAKEVAAAIQNAVEGMGTDDPALIGAIETVKDKTTWKAVEKAYASMSGGESVWEAIKGDVDSYTGTWKRIVKHLTSIGVVVPGDTKAASSADAGQPTGVAGSQGAGQPTGVAGAQPTATPVQGQDLKSTEQAMAVLGSLTPAETKELMQTLEPDQKAIFTKALKQMQQQRRAGK